MKVITIDSWNDFQDYALNIWDQDIMRFRSNYAFRGLSHATYNLVTSLQRTCGHNYNMEKSLIRNFKKYASLQIHNPDNHWEVVSLGQHHFLPTRLMDWTFSPFVALHFATENFSDYDCDGAIWCVDFIKCREYLPSKLKKAINESNSNVFSMDLLNELVKDYNELSAFRKSPFILFFEPPSIDARIINQYALFSVLSDPSTIVSEWLNLHQDICYKIIVPAEKKMEFRDKLDQINMSERYIYPGLDGLCKWLARHYTPTKNIYPHLTEKEIIEINKPQS